MDRILLSRKFYKGLNVNNPISSNIFCADPTSIEFEGRLYVYGTNDQQQYEIVGELGKNTYNEIKSIVCFSTSDMCNWVYEGIIDVEKIAPWIDAAWAPSICSRVEEDGLTHFYLYFSNSGNGVGVLTATSPLGPWSSPLDGPVVHRGIAGVEDVPHPFDPGVVLDDNGDGYLAFGGGSIGDDFMPGTVRIIKLGRDLISVEGSAVEIKAPYFFESSELNFINGWYVYTFNSNWIERKIWPYEAEKSTQCSMNYMITKTPLVTDSWQYVGNYFKNPGDQGLNYSNNHTHLGQFRGQWYLFYHALTLQENMPTNGGFRSICVDKIELSADDYGVNIEMCKGTRQGVPAVGFVDPRSWVNGRLMCTSAEVDFTAVQENCTPNEQASRAAENCTPNEQASGVAENCTPNEQASRAAENCTPAAQVSRAGAAGSWILVKNVNFGDVPAATRLLIHLEYGRTAGEPQTSSQLGVLAEEIPLLQVRLDKLSSECVCCVNAGENGECALDGISGVHDVYFVFLQPNVRLIKWKIQ